jgi:pyruvate dehydrogenase E2 component (dihydrolipoamide acetyltransferase)
MSDEPPQISILDARLAEIDRRLRTIQTGLVTDAAAPAGAAARVTAAPAPAPAAPAAPAAAPSPTLPPAADPASELPPRVAVPEPGSSAAGLRAVVPPAGDQSLAEAIGELHELAVAHENLLGSMRVLLSDYGRALAEARSAPAAAAGGEDVRSLTVTAGPFTGTEAVRGFEEALAALPGVREVELRGYEGGNRAIVDVHLSAATS